MKMRIVKGVMSLMIVGCLCACGDSATFTGSTIGGTIGYYTTGQLATMSSPWGDGSSSHRPAMAVKFTPDSYPVNISSVTIYAKNNTGTDQNFNLYGYNNLSTEANIFNPMLNQIIPVTGSSYTAKTVNIPATTISGGSFYIVVEWVTKPLASLSGANSFFVITDSRLDYPDRNFMRFGDTWTSFESMTNVTAGDVGIVVKY